MYTVVFMKLINMYLYIGSSVVYYMTNIGMMLICKFVSGTVFKMPPKLSLSDVAAVRCADSVCQSQ